MFSRNRRGVLWLLLAAAMLVVGIGVGLTVLRSGLPDPAVASRDELLRWLVTRDLAKESPKTRLVLVQRLEHEFCSGVDWDALKGKTSKEQRKQLWSNIPLLLGPWLSDKASVYSQLSEAKRLQFIDGVIDSLMTWRGADRLQDGNAGSTSQNAGGGLITAMFSQIEECKRDAPPQQRDCISQFVAALQFRFLTR
jgi:hypothetical protein